MSESIDMGGYGTDKTLSIDEDVPESLVGIGDGYGSQGDALEAIYLTYLADTTKAPNALDPLVIEANKEQNQ